MTGEPTDAQREVRDALSTAVNSYGRRVLSDPRVLGNLVTDLLPDFPRERSLLVTAAEAGVAAGLAENVEGQRMDADTAVALAARSLVENRSRPGRQHLGRDRVRDRPRLPGALPGGARLGHPAAAAAGPPAGDTRSAEAGSRPGALSRRPHRRREPRLTSG